MTWTGASGNGFWSNGANWDNFQGPQAGDDVVIVSSTPIIFDTNVGTAALNNLNCNATLIMTGGSLQVAGLGAFSKDTTQLGGSISGPGTLVFSGILNSNGGNMIGAGGKTQIAPGATWNINTSSASVGLGQRMFNIGGTANWFGSNDLITDSGLFQVQGGSTFNITAKANWNKLATGAAMPISVDAGGTLKATNANVQFLSPVSNAGLISESQSTLTLLAGGTWSGQITGSGAVEMSGGRLNLSGNTSIDGVTLRLTGGTIGSDATATPTAFKFSQDGGVLNTLSKFTVTNQWSWIGGVMNNANFALGTGAVGSINSQGVSLSLDACTVANAGAVTWTGDGPLLAGGTTWVNLPGGSFTGSGNGSWSGLGPSTGGSFVNQLGAVFQREGTGTLTVEVPFTNDGTIRVLSGVLRLAGGLTNAQPGTLTGGTYELSGQLRVPNFSVAQNAGNLTISGPNAGFVDDVLNVNALAALASNSGTFSIQGNAVFTLNGTFSNTGTVRVGGNAALYLPGDFTQTSGLTVVNGVLDPAGSFKLNGGKLMGSGTVAASINNQGGLIAPGNSPGLLTVGDDLDDTGSLLAELDGPTPGADYDQIQVNGQVDISGVLTLDRGYIPLVGEQFIIIANDGADKTTGNFIGLPEGKIFNVEGLDFRINYNAGDGNDVMVTRTPATVASALAENGMICSVVRNLTVTFSGLVNLPGNPSDAFSLSRTGPGGPTGPVDVNVDTSLSTATQTIATLTFTGALTEFQSLVDGKYDFKIMGSQITDLGGQNLDGDGNGSVGGDSTSMVKRLFGDIDCDGDVDIADFGGFRAAFNTANYPFDIDLDGDVDTVDFSSFRARFGTMI